MGRYSQKEQMREPDEGVAGNVFDVVVAEEQVVHLVLVLEQLTRHRLHGVVGDIPVAKRSSR